LLDAHETAEELIVRPVTRHLVQGGIIIADVRADEEADTKDALNELEQTGAYSPDFSELFERFAERVLDHADNEEVYEFPLVRAHLDAQALSAMTDAIARTEAVAPTHPHPHIRSMTASVVLGPVASMVDRVRDVLAAGRT
jgi:hemerythrin superfamily protein